MSSSLSSSSKREGAGVVVPDIKSGSAGEGVRECWAGRRRDVVEHDGDNWRGRGISIASGERGEWFMIVMVMSL